MLFPYILNITSSFIVSVLLSVVFLVCVIMPALFFLIVKNLKKCVGYLEKCDFCINTHNSYLIFCFSPTVNHLNIFCYAERK